MQQGRDTIDSVYGGYPQHSLQFREQKGQNYPDFDSINYVIYGSHYHKTACKTINYDTNKKTDIQLLY